MDRSESKKYVMNSSNLVKIYTNACVYVTSPMIVLYEVIIGIRTRYWYREGSTYEPRSQVQPKIHTHPYQVHRPTLCHIAPPESGIWKKDHTSGIGKILNF